MEDIALLGLGIRSDEVDLASRRLDRFEREAGQADRATGRLNRSSVLLTRALGLMGAAVGAAFSLRSVFAFQNAIAEVSTLVDTASFDMKALSNSALEQAAAFGNVQGQVKAYYQIISAGAGTLAEATEILEASNRLAIGGVTDIATAADGLTSVLNAYGDRVESATAVSDALFVAMRAGKTTIGELSAGLGKVAPLAAQTGVSFDELAGAVSALTKGGISTQESITGVRAILAAVAKPTSEATKLANELGLEFNSAALEAKGLSGFLADLVERTGGSTDQLAQLFGGVEALIPAMALAGSAGVSFNQIMEDMTDKAGQTEEAFNKMADSPGFQSGRLMAAITAEAIKLGGVLGEALVPAMRFLADNIEFVTAGAIGLAAAITVTLIPTIVATTAALGAMAIAFLATPFGVLTVLVGALAAVFFHLRQEQDAVAASAREHAAAITTNANAIEVAKTSSQSFRLALRDQIAMQMEAARAALIEADAQHTAARARAMSQRFDVFGVQVFNPFAEAEANAALVSANALDKAFVQLEDQARALDEIMATVPPVPETVTHSVDTLGAALTAANDNGKELGDTLAEAALRAEQEWDFYRGTFSGFFADLKSGLTSGKSLWDSFGDAALNALDKITSRALDMAANGIFDMLFGAVMGGLGGGGFSSQLGRGLTGASVFGGGGGIYGVPGFANGGDFTVGGTGGTDSQMVRFRATPGESVSIRTPGQAANSNGITFAPVTHIEANGSNMTEGQFKAILDQRDKRWREQLPTFVRSIQANPRKAFV